MPLGYEIVSQTPQVRVVATGAVSMSEMIAIFDRVADDHRYSPHFTLTFDMRAASYTAQLSDGDALVAVLKRRSAEFQNRLALVVPESLHLLGRLYCTLVSVGGFDRIRCFTDMDQAEAWCVAES